MLIVVMARFCMLVIFCFILVCWVHLDFPVFLQVVCMCVFHHVQFFTISMDCSLPDSSVHGIFQARILEWLPFATPGDLPGSGIEAVSSVSSALAGRFFTTAPPEKPKLHVRYLKKVVI